jgi:dihydrofolate synthase/folylpolyglutamate synthase
VADALLADCIVEALDAGPDLSFFEAATLAAFLAFRHARVEMAVLEVGLGGRLDATNVVPSPRVCGITRIAWDHADLLGDTLEAIAAEKAGIAKPDVPLWVGSVSTSVYEAIARVARDRGAPVHRLEQARADGVFDDAVREGLPLGGGHQVHNARLACVLARAAGASDTGIARGLRDVRWPGRLERISVGPVDVILDAAHNVDGVEALLSYLQASGSVVGHSASPHNGTAVRPPVLVFGAMADKPYGEMLRRLASVCLVRHYVAPEGRKPAELSELCALAPGTAHPSIDAALLAAVDTARHGTVLVTGSIYLVGAARARLLGIPRDPPIAL